MSEKKEVLNEKEPGGLTIGDTKEEEPDVLDLRGQEVLKWLFQQHLQGKVSYEDVVKWFHAGNGGKRRFLKMYNYH